MALDATKLPNDQTWKGNILQDGLKNENAFVKLLDALATTLQLQNLCFFVFREQESRHTWQIQR